MNLIIAHYLTLKKQKLQKYAAKINWFVQTFSSKTELLNTKIAIYNCKGTEVEFSPSKISQTPQFTYFINSLKPHIFSLLFVQNLQYITIGLMQNKDQVLLENAAISNKDLSTKVLVFETPFSTHIIA